MKMLLPVLNQETKHERYFQYNRLICRTHGSILYTLPITLPTSVLMCCQIQPLSHFGRVFLQRETHVWKTPSQWEIHVYTKLTHSLYFLWMCLEYSIAMAPFAIISHTQFLVSSYHSAVPRIPQIKKRTIFKPEANND